MVCCLAHISSARLWIRSAVGITVQDMPGGYSSGNGSLVEGWAGLPLIKVLNLLPGAVRLSVSGFH
jgi:hypothetical protein